MKKALITASVALLSTMVASAATLVYHEDFNDYEANTNTKNPAGTEGDLSFNFGGAYTIAGLNLSATTGFSVALDIWDNKDWKSPFTMVLQGQEYMLQVNSSGHLKLYVPTDEQSNDPLGLNGKELTSTDIRQTWTHVALTFEGSSLKAYINGTLATELTMKLSDYTIGNMGKVSGANEPSAKDNLVFIDNVGIYSGVLTGDEVALLASNPSAGGNLNAIPEPATATLSLLALAGLCARRRRK